MRLRKRIRAIGFRRWRGLSPSPDIRAEPEGGCDRGKKMKWMDSYKGLL